MKSHHVGVAVALIAGITAAPALAQSVKSLGDFRDWSSYSATGTAGDICFAMTRPTRVDPIPSGYTQGYLYLTDRPAEGISNELNFLPGYNFESQGAATLTVGDQTFTLFTENDAAWLEDPAQGDALAGAIRAGSTLTIEGTSATGETVTETFSLSGATAASHAIDGAC